MKYYRLKKSASEYVCYKQGVIYREDFIPYVGLGVYNCVRTWPKEWKEVEEFKFGRKFDV